MRVLYDDILRYRPAAAGLARPRPHDPEQGPWLHRALRDAGRQGLLPARRRSTRSAAATRSSAAIRKPPRCRASRPRPARSGTGCPIGVGMALAARIRQRDSRVFVVIGDGEINEGSVWEAALCAGKHRLANLTAVIDYNKLQSAGPTREIQDLEPLADKWRAFGFAVDGGRRPRRRGAARGLLAAAARRRPADARSSATPSRARAWRSPRATPSWHHKSKPNRADRAWRTRKPRRTAGASGSCARLDAPDLPQHGARARAARRARGVHRLRSQPRPARRHAQGNARALVHGGRHRGERDRHGGRPRDGGLRALRQHDRDLHHAALLRAGRGRPLPAQSAGAPDRQWRRARLRAARADPSRDRGHRDHARAAEHDRDRRVRRARDDAADGGDARLARPDLYPPRQGRRPGRQPRRGAALPSAPRSRCGACAARASPSWRPA